MALRNLQVGDRLSVGTKLVFSFPVLPAGQQIPAIVIANMNNGYSIGQLAPYIVSGAWSETFGLRLTNLEPGNATAGQRDYWFRRNLESPYQVYTNLTQYTFTTDYGTITSIDNRSWYLYVRIEVPDPPTISSITPNTGVQSGGTSVVITGTNFAGTTSVKFGSVNSPSFVVNSSTQITAVTPANAVGTVLLTVTTPYGYNTLSNAFTYTASRPSKCRVLEVGDTIPNGETTYLNFPSSPFLPIPNDTVVQHIIDFASNAFFWSSGDTTPVNPNLTVAIRYMPGYDSYLYRYSNLTVSTNSALYTFTRDEIVSSVSKNNQYYHSIKKHDPNLRNIVVGDNLTNKTIYFDFPNNLYSQLTSGTTSIINLGAGDFIRVTKAGNVSEVVAINNSFQSIQIYRYEEGGLGLVVNRGYTPISHFFSRTVLSIISNDPAYQYIYVLDAPTSPYSVWDGATWKVITPKVHDGSSWKNINI